MIINTAYSTIYISSDIQKILIDILHQFKNRKLFIIVDENTQLHCLPAINSIPEIRDSEVIKLISSEKNKSIESLQKVWKELTEKGADRSSVLINLGGGIIGDLGGFAASCFKRGIDFINIPTTLLSQVDASVGGKTGVNFLGFKNEIGVFNHPKFVIVDSAFNRTLNKKQLLSGWAEMLKHALIFDEKDWQNLITYDIKQIGFKELNQLIARSVSIKNYFVEKDPLEKDIRKALNFGHTIGHALESLYMSSENEISHGEAVAHGMICELYLSMKSCNFPINKMKDSVSYLFKTYNKLTLDKSDFDKIISLIAHDKKNEGSNINFTLLEDFGKIKINQNCSRELLIETLTWYKSL